MNSKLQEEILQKEITLQQLIKETNDLRRQIDDLNQILISKKEKYREKFKNSNQEIYAENQRLRVIADQALHSNQETKMENALLAKDQELL